MLYFPSDATGAADDDDDEDEDDEGDYLDRFFVSSKEPRFSCFR